MPLVNKTTGIIFLFFILFIYFAVHFFFFLHDKPAVPGEVGLGFTPRPSEVAYPGALLRVVYVHHTLLGFLYTTIVLPDNHGEYPSIQPNFWPVCYRGTFIVPISTTKSLHVHHWTITLALILLFPLPEIVYGFCVCFALFRRTLGLSESPAP